MAAFGLAFYFVFNTRPAGGKKFITEDGSKIPNNNLLPGATLWL